MYDEISVAVAWTILNSVWINEGRVKEKTHFGSVS